jgi:hypothetical protein
MIETRVNAFACLTTVLQRAMKTLGQLDIGAYEM